ncbi:type I methionyl aminopeptidase [Candidatus Riesia pediculischaeffi]|uniref:Methionine aminopeptidase n=1 Tax=Candidatus Riesia pediculischaeffi TaxID=428411 RepID=A0A1V0HKM4_9ENTR|nr:type I methionyl aminopeptidase [Candidatus Riesia pediculischaeffi]ARC53271.1 methionine aminopeptidase [Candidatus Riesia pediculischaeffi]
MINLITNKEDIQKMRIVGKISARVLEFIHPYIQPGISTEEIDNICHDYITKNMRAFPACLNYHGFPKSICTSINDVICHGIPNKYDILKDKDIINVDVAVFKDGFYSDTSKMFFVGKPNKNSEFLCKVAQLSLYLAIKLIKPGLRLRSIGKTIQEFVEKNHFSVVKEYCGHGIGRSLHEDPPILHYDTDDKGIKLKKGMIFTIEPMVNSGSSKSKLMKDGWTVKTIDESLSAQYEHTVLVTEDGCEVLTLREEESFLQEL